AELPIVGAEDQQAGVVEGGMADRSADVRRPGAAAVRDAQGVHAAGEGADEAQAFRHDGFDPRRDHLVVEVAEPLPFEGPLERLRGVAGALGVAVQGRPGILGGEEGGEQRREREHDYYTAGGAYWGLRPTPGA